MLQSMIFKVIHGHNRSRFALWDVEVTRPGKKKVRVLLLHFLPSMQNECWLNSDWSWSSGEILPLLDQKNEGYTGVNSFFSLKLSSMRFQARHIWRDTSCAYYGRISLSDGLRMSQMMFSCPSLRAFIVAFILFSLPLLQRASAHISAAAIQLCSMRGDSNHFPLQHQLMRDKWGENYTVKFADEYWTTGRNFFVFLTRQNYILPHRCLIESLIASSPCSHLWKRAIL